METKVVTVAAGVGAAAIALVAHRRGRTRGEKSGLEKAARQRATIAAREAEMAEAHRRGILEAEREMARERRARRARRARTAVATGVEAAGEATQQATAEVKQASRRAMRRAHTAMKKVEEKLPIG